MLDSNLTQSTSLAQPASSDAARESGRPLIVVADDHKEMRDALSELFEQVGLDTLCFESASDLIDATLPDRVGCFVLDVRMPGPSGLNLQADLAGASNPMPVIFITGHDDVSISIRAIKAGAVDFLTKPLREQELLDAVWSAIDLDRVRKSEERRRQANTGLFNDLSNRERQVLRLLANGNLNKQMAYELGVRESTIKLHRGNLMRKLSVGSLAETIRFWESLPTDLREGDAFSTLA